MGPEQTSARHTTPEATPESRTDTAAQTASRFVFRGEAGRNFQVGGVTGCAITTGSYQASVGVALLSVAGGRHGLVKDLVSERTYIIQQGTGHFTVDGVELPVTENDVVVIPPNTPYDFSGNMKLALVCSPPFDPKNDIALE